MNDWVLEESCERSSVIPSHFGGEEKKSKIFENRIFQMSLEVRNLHRNAIRDIYKQKGSHISCHLINSSSNNIAL